MGKGIVAFLSVLGMAFPARSAEFNAALEFPAGLAADIWVSPMVSFGVEGSHSEVSRGLSPDPQTLISRRTTLTRNYLYGVRVQWRGDSPTFLGPYLVQVAGGQMTLSGRLEPGGASAVRTGETSAGYVRLMGLKRWEWPGWFTQVGLGIRFESESSVTVEADGSRGKVSESPLLGGGVIHGGVGLRF